MDCGKIKLIVWDLDETFWPGILSDHTAVYDERMGKLVRDVTDAGVINAICSKNDRAQVEEFLKDRGVWDYFVFNSIDWSPKGERVAQIIREMNLRSANVLFIDDNALNLQEAKNCCPGLMVSGPEIIPQLIGYFEKIEKHDLAHARLDQYKVLEKKQQFKAISGSNEAFLRDCDIRVDVHDDCLAHLDRISDLVLRSNQLNFTKLRSTYDELDSLCRDESVKTGYVHVSDKFGDYGIVGFFALRDGALVHFVFSCRTLNMGVEQYVYHLLDRPRLEIVGEVASSLDGPTPDWINADTQTVSARKESLLDGEGKILIKGPCDINQIFAFIKDSKNIIQELTYVNDRGISVETFNHTMHIVESVTLAPEVKERLIRSLPFGDKDMFHTVMFDPSLKVIVYSLFVDPTLAIYREKESGAIISFGDWTNDLTDESQWEKHIKKEVFVDNCDFTPENLRYIKDHFEYLGRIQPEETVRNLDFIYSRLSKDTILILNLGSEIPYEGKKKPSYEDRHLFNKRLNDLVKSWSADKENVYLTEVTKYIESQDDYTNEIDHFSKRVYYLLSQDMIKIINEHSAFALKRGSPFFKRCKRGVKKLCRRLFKVSG